LLLVPFQNLLGVFLHFALSGIQAGIGNGRNGKRQTEKDKQGTSYDLFHEFSTKQVTEWNFTTGVTADEASFLPSW
jgi:hypothetical protein